MKEINAIGVASPFLILVLTIDVYPPFLPSYLGAISLINFLVDSLHCNAANTVLCVFKSAFLAVVTNFSIYLFSSFAFGTVVSIFSLSIIAIAKFFSNAFL